jgi:iron-sulfur cluster assembly protein
MFKVTEAAADQVRRAAQQSGTEGMALRLAARQKADGSIDYLMGFDDAKEDDIRFNTEGVEIIMAPEDAPLLDQTVMDFVELDEGQHQFIFLNPKDSGYVPPQGSSSN